jgi:hypothetical protein
MTTYDIAHLKCPHCGTIMTTYDLMSYTVHHNDSWSDGKTGFGIPDSINILICANCKAPFWKDDARLPSDTESPEEKYASAMDIYDLEWRFDDDRDEKIIVFYKNLLENGFDDGSMKELHVRTHIWRCINDLIRNLSGWRGIKNLGQLSGIFNHRRETKALFKSYSTLFDENLDRLIFLFIKSADIDLLYLANMYRERGNFSKAKEILEKVEHKGSTWKKVKKKVNWKNRLVFKL